MFTTLYKTINGKTIEKPCLDKAVGFLLADGWSKSKPEIKVKPKAKPKAKKVKANDKKD